MALYPAAAFKVLHPLLERITEKVNAEDCDELKQIITQLKPETAQKLHEFILVPLMNHVLNPTVWVETKIRLLDCAYEVLHRVYIPDAKHLLKLMNSLMMQLFDRETPSMLRAVPEEMKHGIVRCVLAIVLNMRDDVQENFYIKDNVPSICQVVYICIQLAELEKLRPLRICAMNVILALTQAPQDGGEDRRSPDERKVVADIFQFVFPGVTSKLTSIVSGDATQGSQVTLTAVHTLGEVIALVMEDYSAIEHSESISGMIDNIMKMSSSGYESCGNFEDTEQVPKPTNRKEMSEALSAAKGRTPEWRRKTAHSLEPFISKMAAQYVHPHWKVRREVARAAHIILRRCPFSLKNALSSLLDALVVLSIDEEEHVKKISEAALADLSRTFTDTTTGCNFLQLVEENFYMLLTRLPRLVQEEGSAKGAGSLALVSGYVRILGPNLRIVLSSSAHLQRLTLSLLHTLTLDCSTVNIVYEYSVRDLKVEQWDSLNVPWIRLKYSPDGVALFHLKQLCKLLTHPESRALDLLGPQLLDILTAVLPLQKEAVLVLNALLLAGADHKNMNMYQLALDVLDLYLSTDFWQPKHELVAVSTLVESQQKSVLACLLTDGVGCCISVLGQERARPHLLRVLYPLLERAGSAQNMISLAGRCSLTRIASVFGYGLDLVSLIASNMDYISYQMTTRLRHSDHQPGVFDALSLVLQYSSPAIALGLHDVVLSVLKESKVSGHSSNVSAHLRVFLTFAQGIRVWLASSAASDSEQSGKSHHCISEEPSDDTSDEETEIPILPFSPSPKRQNLLSGVKRFKEYVDSIQADLEGETEHSDSEDKDQISELDEDRQPHILADKLRKETENLEPENDENTKENVPELIKLLVSVLQRCLHFLPSHTVDHQFLALRTLRAGLGVLKAYPDTLLPIAHQTWAPLVGRLRADQPPLIIRSAFQLLRTLTHNARDFLRVRVLKEVMPELTKYLHATVHQSRLQDRGSAYRFTQAYKAQLTLLRGLGPLSCHLDLRSTDFNPLLVAALPYLSSFQPQPLQNACIRLIQSLQKLDADAVWWALVSLWTPPHLSSTLQLSSGTSDHECKANVCLLLDLPNN